jgi:toxin ParE1/3/4
LSRIAKTTRAEEDLDEIWLYVALDNITAADAVLDEFERTCRLLSLRPNMGRIREKPA